MVYLTIAIAMLIGGGIGFKIGSYLTTDNLASIPWRFYRWDTNTFGYRPIHNNTLVMPGDKVVMGFDLITKHLPPEGVTVTEFVNNPELISQGMSE
jgi:hypothetical protein